MDRKSFEELLKSGALEDMPDDQEKIMSGNADEHAADPVEPEEQPAYPKLNTFSATDLQNTNDTPIHFIIENLLTPGLSILASPPKYGKSWMVLALCIAVASGEKFLGHPTNRCGCLYLALEDSRTRLKSRLEKLLAGKPAPRDIYFSTESNCVDHGLLDELASFLSEHPNVGLIVIDTLQRVRGGTHLKESAYAADYREMTQLKVFADRHNVAILLVHHLRKMKDDGDPFNMISGTNGIMGAADTTIVLTKDNRNDNQATMSITGRDVESEELTIQFDKQFCRWENLGDKSLYNEKQEQAAYQSNPIVLAVKKLLEPEPHIWTGTAKQFLDENRYSVALPLSLTPRSFTERLKELSGALHCNDGIVCERAKNGSGGGKYTFYYHSYYDTGEMDQTTLNMPVDDN